MIALHFARRAALHLSCALAPIVVAAPAMAADAPDLAISLSPKAEASGALTQMGVAIRIEAPPAEGVLVSIATKENTVVTSADTMTGLLFTDARGVLPVEASDEAIDDDNARRSWKAARPVEGAVTLAYRVSIDPRQPDLAAPQYELRAAEGGLSGAGNAFLVLPADEVARDVSVRWNLASAGTEQGGDVRAISSLGAGNVSSTAPLPPAKVDSMYFMVGDIGAYEQGTFFGAWQGRFGFEGEQLMGWASRFQRFYGDFFDQRPASFGVFARTNRTNPGSGIGLTDSFAFTFDEQTPLTDLKGLLAHEMVHAWINSLSGSMDQPGGLGMSWFGEGLAVHYQRLLPWRAGLISSEAFLEDLNSTAGRYYTNALIATPNEDIAGGFWKDTRIRVLPYDRGSLYFASVDAQIRKASNNAHSLDDLVREMLAERRAGRAMDLALWKRLLERELGAPGLARFEAMLAGETVEVPSDAFGPCFTRIVKPLRRFDLGFDPLVLLSKDRVVAGLDPASSAYAAGLRNGDRILNRFPQDAMQGDQEATLTLQLERAGERFELTYLPRGESVDAWQWQAAPGQPDCK
ncbi:peptidase M61 [Novosphingobium sp. YJ-S2-02]|uniref:Peptidase M61 n=1 Tax=Novosphingobium aureum TaxID=2792964 RepID=A0A931MMV3_9SPHN|nr:peptidase M61 [Novosphingobium aureum]MBH0114536.1 peptidase M61 [Novosphingobium aureum]